MRAETAMAWTLAIIAATLTASALVLPSPTDATITYNGPHRIGFFIQTEDFDEDNNFDVDFTPGPGGAAYGRPSQTIDIEANVGAQNGFAVAYADSGEYVAYTLPIPQDRFYTIYFRYATNEANRVISFHAKSNTTNTRPFTTDTYQTFNITLSNTNSYTTFATSSRLLYLPANTQLFMWIRNGPVNTDSFSVTPSGAQYSIAWPNDRVWGPQKITIWGTIPAPGQFIDFSVRTIQGPGQVTVWDPAANFKSLNATAPGDYEVAVDWTLNDRSVITVVRRFKLLAEYIVFWLKTGATTYANGDTIELQYVYTAGGPATITVSFDGVTLTTFSREAAINTDAATNSGYVNITAPNSFDKVSQIGMTITAQGTTYVPQDVVSVNLVSAWSPCVCIGNSTTGTQNRTNPCTTCSSSDGVVLGRLCTCSSGLGSSSSSDHKTRNWVIGIVCGVVFIAMVVAIVVCRQKKVKDFSGVPTNTNIESVA